MEKFDFWKNNKAADHFQLTTDQLISKIIPWIYIKELVWLKQYGTEMSTIGFITGKDGLSSVYEQSQFKRIVEALFNTIMNIVATSDRLVKVLEPIKEKNPKNCNTWEGTLRPALKENAGIMPILAELREQYQENPLGMEQILGYEASELLKKLPLRKPI